MYWKLEPWKVNLCIDGRLTNVWDSYCKVDLGFCRSSNEDLGVACGSPVLIDLGAEGFHFTDIDHGVSFDIDADGTADRVAWTSPGARDAFVVLDRNANGKIDNAGELFGDATMLLDGTFAPNGYVALRELDQVSEGGNDNGYIDPVDAYYWKLRLWTDRNHDGISQPAELSSLFENGVVSLALEYTSGSEQDDHGNLLSFSSTASLTRHGRLVSTATTDVFFLVAP